MSELECPHCGDVAAYSDDRGLFYDGQPITCGCSGIVSLDAESPPYVATDGPEEHDATREELRDDAWEAINERSSLESALKIPRAEEWVESNRDVNAALNALAEYVPPPKWVPVAERLPSASEARFVWGIGFDGVTALIEVQLFRFCHRSYTHWAPIVAPKPPAETEGS